MFVVAMLVSTSASADRKQRQQKAAAKKHMEKAAAASKDGRSEDALKELDAAWALDPQPMLLLARGHLYVKLNKCEDAIKLYEEYVATKPEQELADSATQAIEACKVALAPPPPPPPPPPEPVHVTSEEINADDENPTLVKAQPAPPRPEPQPATVQVDQPTRRSAFADPILIGLGAGGVLSIAAGVVLYTSARGKISDAEDAMSYDAWKSLTDDAHGLRTYSIICGAAGAALVGGAVFYFLSKHGDDEQPRVTFSPTQRGGVVGWTGRF